MADFLFIEPTSRGGLLHHAHKLADAVAQRGHSVKLACGKDPETLSLPKRYELLTRFRDRGTMGASRSTGKILVDTSRLALELLWVILSDGRGRSHIVFSSTQRQPLTSAHLALAKFLGCTTVLLCHEFQLREESPSLLARVASRLAASRYGAFGRIVFMSEHQRNAFAGEFPDLSDRLHVIPMGNSEIFRDFADSSAAIEVGRKPYILFFGRIRRDKGIEDLIDAWRRIDTAMRSKFRVVVAGHVSDDLRDFITETKDDLQDELVLIDSYVDSEAVWQLVDGATVAVFPYRSASQSAAVHVAKLAKTALIATDVGGLAGVITSDEAVIVPSSDPIALSVAIERILADGPSDLCVENSYRSELDDQSWALVAGRLQSELGISR